MMTTITNQQNLAVSTGTPVVIIDDYDDIMNAIDATTNTTVHDNDTVIMDTLDAIILSVQNDTIVNGNVEEYIMDAQLSNIIDNIVKTHHIVPNDEKQDDNDNDDHRTNINQTQQETRNCRPRHDTEQNDTARIAAEYYETILCDNRRIMNEHIEAERLDAIRLAEIHRKNRRINTIQRVAIHRAAIHLAEEYTKYGDDDNSIDESGDDNSVDEIDNNSVDESGDDNNVVESDDNSIDVWDEHGDEISSDEYDWFEYAENH